MSDPNDDQVDVQLLVTLVPLTAAPPELIEWVEGILQDFLTGAGKKGEVRWCERWTEHPEAVHRLAAMYDEWLVMRIGGKGAPSLHMFVREVLDYHLPHLTNKEDGTFARCDVDGHEPHRRLDHAITHDASTAPR